VSDRLLVVVDRQACFSFGICVETLPDVFVWDEEDKPVIQPFTPDETPLGKLKEAVEGCPRGALTLVDGDGRTVWSEDGAPAP